MARIGELIGPNGEVMHPKTSAEVVYLEDGRTVEQVLSDDVDYGNVVFQDNSYKFDSDVEDDFAKTVIIKGQTYQNILPEPSTHVLTNNKEMFKVNEGLDPNVEVVDGVSKSAILSGQTLVNLLDTEMLKDDNNINAIMGVTLDKDYFISDHTAGQFQISKDNKSPLDGKLMEGKTYTLVMTVNTTDKTSDGADVYLGLDSTTHTAGTKFLDNANGVVKIKFTPSVKETPSTGSRLQIGFYNRAVVKISRKIMLLKGDYTNVDIPYFEGMQSVKMPVLKTTGKNLVSGIELGSYDDFGNKINGFMYTTARCTEPIYIGDGETFYAWMDEGGKNSIGSNGVWYHAFDKNKKWVRSFNGYSTKITLKEGECYIVFRTHEQHHQYVNGNHKMMISKEPITSYEPFKSNILTVNENIELNSIGDVYDELNATTGELTQRLIKMSNLGDYDMPNYTIHDVTDSSSVPVLKFSFNLPFKIVDTGYGATNNFPLVCDKFKIRGDENGYSVDRGSYVSSRNNQLFLHLIKEEVGLPTDKTITKEIVKEFLKENPIEVTCRLVEPILKTVDLSSSGNWEKVVLDGSEDGWFLTSNASQTTVRFRMNLNPQSYGVETGFCDRFAVAGNTSSSMETESIMLGDTITIRIKKDKAETLNEFKQWLSQNPVTVWYQTQTHLDSTQVKQPIFFKDGHIQLSSGADNSLIPTLDYQAKTSNSYVMDLMKTNTKYTMKAKSASGTFTIDGTSYEAGTNGTFTTPSSMTNKFLVMSNNANEEIMILEGDVTEKTIPYFKGIKSVFEGEDKIEVLSTSQNILDTSKIVQGDLLNSGVTAATGGSGDLYCYTEDFIPCPNIKHPLYVHRTIDGVYSPSTYYIFFFDEDKRLLQPRTVSNTFTIPDGAKYLRIMVHKGNIDVSRVGIMVTNSGTDRFNQSVGGLQNNTKIPLLSPLRSLPNGVCDELIIDRMKKKATLIQRVGICKFDSKDKYNCSLYTNGDWATNNSTGLVYRGYTPKGIDLVENESGYHICNSLTTSTRRDISSKTDVCVLGNGPYMGLKISNDKIGYNGRLANDYLSKNPVVVYYQLATPVITEVDLEGFPYIYKDGHIFLNSEIAPTVGIEYGINQGHRIEGQVEMLQRHEKQFSKLEQYFADLVYSDYNFALLRFSEKLRQQEGDV